MLRIPVDEMGGGVGARAAPSMLIDEFQVLYALCAAAAASGCRRSRQAPAPAASLATCLPPSRADPAPCRQMSAITAVAPTSCQRIWATDFADWVTLAITAMANGTAVAIERRAGWRRGRRAVPASPAIADRVPFTARRPAMVGLGDSAWARLTARVGYPNAPFRRGSAGPAHAASA